MAVCKRCGCAIPLGSKNCDMCAAVGSVAPVQQPEIWQPPVQTGPPVELASSAASWVGGRDARPTSTVELEKARKAVRRAARVFMIVGGITAGLGLVVELANITSLQGFVNWGTVAEGSVFLVLALFAWRGSIVAIGIGTVLYILDTLILLATGHFSVLRILIILWLGQAFLSANVLRRHQKRSAAAAVTGIPPDQARAA